jgi:hypothetical protein
MSGPVALALQRSVGNQTAALVLQRYEVALNGGGRVADTDSAGANVRENVLVVMDRLHSMWALNDADYAREYAAVTALAGGATVNVASIPATVAALGRSREASVAAPVAETQLHLAISGGVGAGQPNAAADVAAVQDLVHSNALMTDADYGTVLIPGERLIIDSSGPSVDPARVPKTMAGLTAVKQRLVSGTPLALGLVLSGPLAAQELLDIAAFELAKVRHEANRTQIKQWIEEGYAQNADRRLKNTCEWIRTRRTPFFMLTATHDSAARAAAAGQVGGAAYFSYPAGDLYAPSVAYKRKMPTENFDNTNVDVEASPTVDGFQDPTNGIALMESTIPKGKDYLLGVLMHEVQHKADLHGATDLEGYKTEFRAYWLGSKEYNNLSATRKVRHFGYVWTARQWAIFNHMYSSADYAYVKTAWDAEAGHHAQPFRSGVLSFRWPSSVNPNNSVRIDAFAAAVTAASYADCAADTAATPNPNVEAVRQAVAALQAGDKRDVKNSVPLQRLMLAHLRGRVLRQAQVRL